MAQLLTMKITRYTLSFSHFNFEGDTYMDNLIKNFLFTKHVLVAEQKGKDQVLTMYALLNKLNIEIISGFEHVHPDMIRFCANQLGEYIPTPFYSGFPKSVLELTPEQRLLDQLIHYTITYGYGDFESKCRSVFEDARTRSIFKEADEPKEFRILTETEAVEEFKTMCDSLASSTRPLNLEMLNLLMMAYNTYKWFPSEMGKQNACTMLYQTKDVGFTKFLNLADVIKLVDMIQWSVYHKRHLNNLNLKNTDRKFITSVLDKILEQCLYPLKDICECVEKRKIWKGLLHHIHYTPKSVRGRIIISYIYTKDVRSAYSEFERVMNTPRLKASEAARYLKNAKGNGAVLRKLNYIMQKANTDEEIRNVLSELDNSASPIIILQMLNMYRNYKTDNRIFKFTRHGKVYTHKEENRKSCLSQDKINAIINQLTLMLENTLKGRAGKVYITPEMDNIAIPMNMSAGESGFGVLPTGSRFALPEGKKIRAFTYWEKINDIDLSCFGLDKDFNYTEFSWRTMSCRQSEAVTYSGDVTNGYNGGSEYFDIIIEEVLKQTPDMRYMIFCDNVYTSGRKFSDGYCRAGWMARNTDDSGEIYEPKTVRSAYSITGDISSAYLFAIDLLKREVIWLNLSDAKEVRVAGTNDFSWLYDAFTLVDTMSIGKLFRLMGEVVDTPEEAELVVGDIETDKPQIRSWEFEKVIPYLK